MMRRGTKLSDMRSPQLAAFVIAVCLWSGASHAQMPTTTQATPKVGDKARDFTLQSLDGATVRLSEEVARGPLVLVVLRGWPGYQCPFCTRQFGDFLANAAKFERNGARVLFVYPGPGDGLKAHAEAFAASTSMPAGFRILLDPDYIFTHAYGLRWDAPKETAYPSTFVLDKNGIVMFAHTSRAHGDRVPAEVALKALAESPR
jgi:thioredoxin-dependent peroxiredoxin